MRTFAVAGLALALLAAAGPARAQSPALDETFARGMALYRAGRPAEAEPFWRAAVAQAEREFGPDSPRLAAGLDYLANLYRDLGRYAEAEPLYARELAIDGKALGPEHAYVGAALGNLALLYRLEGRYAEAEPLFRRALAIQARALGPDHPEVATTLSNLAGLYRHQGRDADAEALYARALAIDEKALGPDHPSVARIRGNLAALHGAPGQAAEAGPPPTTPTPAGFQRVTLDALTGYRLARSVPLALAIPAGYAPLDLAASGRPGWFWADPGEYERLRAGATSTRGAFWARLTTNVGYDPGRDGFICGPDCTEADIRPQFEKGGTVVARMERRTVGGVPVLLLEATPPPPAAAETPRVYMAYVALGVDTNVLLISYRPPAGDPAEGERVWATFERSLSAP